MKRIRVRVKGAKHRAQANRYGVKALLEGRSLYPEQPGVDYHRPKRRSECRGMGGPKAPCPYASCSSHIGVEVTRAGSLKVHAPDGDITVLPWTCMWAVIEAHPDGVPPPMLATILGIGEGYVLNVVAEARRKVHLPMIQAGCG